MWILDKGGAQAGDEAPLDHVAAGFHGDSVRELALGPYEIDSLGPGPTALRIPAKARGKRRAAKMPEGGGLADHMNPCSILQWWV